MVSAISSGVGIILGGTPGVILGAATKAFGAFSSLDKDDELGSTELEISATGPSKEERSWLIEKEGSSWSNWDYTLRYRIARS
jgi:hypothetical protein